MLRVGPSTPWGCGTWLSIDTTPKPPPGEAVIATCAGSANPPTANRQPPTANCQNLPKKRKRKPSTINGTGVGIENLALPLGPKYSTSAAFCSDPVVVVFTSEEACRRHGVMPIAQSEASQVSSAHSRLGPSAQYLVSNSVFVLTQETATFVWHPLDGWCFSCVGG